MFLCISLIFTSLLYQKVNSKLPEDCILKHDTGSCDEPVGKFYYNSTTGKCNNFVYGGCKGNDNRFDSVADCLEACGKKVHANTTFGDCLLEEDHGHCRGKLERYFYDSNTGDCETFEYGGCLGNANEFKSKKECEQYCAARTGRKCSNEKSASKVCQIYFECVNETGFTKLCKNGLVFNPNTKNCEDPDGVPACQQISQTNPCFNRENGVYPTEECNVYIKCWDNVAQFHVCPFASVYSNVSKNCDYLKYSPGCATFYPNSFVVQKKRRLSKLHTDNQIVAPNPLPLWTY